MTNVKNLKEEFAQLSKDSLYFNIISGCRTHAETGKNECEFEWKFNDSQSQVCECEKLYDNLKNVSKKLEDEGLEIELKKEIQRSDYMRWLDIKYSVIKLRVRW